MANLVFLLHSQQGLAATSSKMFLRKYLSKAGFLCWDNFKVILHELGRPGAAILVIQRIWFASLAWQAWWHWKYPAWLPRIPANWACLVVVQSQKFIMLCLTKLPSFWHCEPVWPCNQALSVISFRKLLWNNGRKNFRNFIVLTKKETRSAVRKRSHK